jgi:hypothetical protein
VIDPDNDDNTAVYGKKAGGDSFVNTGLNCRADTGRHKDLSPYAGALFDASIALK